MTLFLELLALAGLILLNAFFVAAEYGLVTSRRTRIRALDRGRPGRARPGAAGCRARGALGSRAANAALELGRAGRDRARRAGDGDAGLRLRRQAGERRDGRAAGGRRPLDRPTARGGAA